MGDRGNIVVIHDKRAEEQIWLYTHWGGSCLAESLQAALKAYPGRWDDAGYLARGILMKMIPPEYRDQETGSGIYTSMTDNEHDILVCDVARQIVFTLNEEQLDDKGRVPAGFEPVERRTFEEFSRSLILNGVVQ